MTTTENAPAISYATVLDERDPAWDRRNALGYLAGLDGIRALSALAVVAYHLEASWAAGGYLGVEVFFVVSGYLITRLLLDEHRRTDAVDRVAFWLRRARRLLPAVAALIVGVGAWSLLVVGGDDFSTFRSDVVASAFYVQNWHAIVTDQPYFAAFGRPSPLRHVWSLAIEEQFYLLWPVLLPWSLRRLGRRTTAMLLVPAIGASVLLMSLTADIAAPERAYYGTDTRAFGILIGGLLAFGWRPERARRTLAAPAGIVVDGLGVAALAVLLWQFANRSEFDPWTYPQGFLLVDVATVVLLVVATHPATRLARHLGAPAIAALGRRSYSLYLWHWPVIVYTRPEVDWGLEGTTALVARLALIAGLTELSYRFVEQPFRDGRIQAWFAEVRSGPRRRRMVRTLAAGALATTLGATTALVTAPRPVQQVALTRAPIVTTTSVPVDAAETASPPTSTPAIAADAPVSSGKITVVGESVTLGAAPVLGQHFGDRVAVDAVEGRSVGDGIELIERMAAEGRLHPTVVVHIGNNGAIPPGGLERVRAAVGPERTLVLVTVRVPRRWEGQVNDEIRRMVAAHPEIRLADWHQIANADPTLLIDDGVHLSAWGQVRYTQMVAAAQE